MRCRVFLSTAVVIAAAVSAVAQPSVPTLSPPSDVAVPTISSTQPDLNAGVSPRSPSKTDIQNLLAQVTEAAVGKGELPTLVGYLSKADRNAIGDVRDKQWADLDGRIDQFHKDWQAAFGISFRLTDKQSVIYGDESFPIRPGNEAQENPTTGLSAGVHHHRGNQLQGPTTEPSSATMRSNAASLGGASGGGQTPTDNAMAGATTMPGAFPIVPPNPNLVGENPSQDEATEVRFGTVELPATAHKPPRFVKLINEGAMVASWKIDLPTPISAQRLHDSLLRRITWLDEHRASWPTEITEAYQVVSREMLAALLDASGPPRSDSAPATQP